MPAGMPVHGNQTHTIYVIPICAQGYLYPYRRISRMLLVFGNSAESIGIRNIQTSINFSDLKLLEIQAYRNWWCNLQISAKTRPDIILLKRQLQTQEAMRMQHLI